MGIPVGYTWQSLRSLSGSELETHYIDTLRALSTQPGTLGQIFTKSQNKIQIIELIDALPPQERIKVQQYVEQGYVQIPLYDAHPSAGYGSYVESVQVLEHFPFRRGWILSELKVNPSQLHLVQIQGESMEPTLKRGDLVMVNPEVEEVKEGIYVIRLDGMVMVKRLQKLPRGRIRVASDHESYAEYEVNLWEKDVDFQLIGQVIWTGKIL